MGKYEKKLISIFMNFNETLEKNEKSWRNQGGILTKLLISQLLCAVKYQTLYQIMPRKSAFTKLYDILLKI